ncbi:hypothetical protein ACIBSW_26840 [Actinoplanes sp. NPDC049668]|uniref:hypothetical protein n=1 Tax=unclassified Actinoplanes TaxID=2626549 RepID=UPI0033A7EEC8
MSVNKRQIALVAGVAVLILIGLAVGRSARNDDGPGTLDGPATQACDDFAAGVDDAGTKAERLALADKVNASSAQSDNEAISERAAAMGRSANGTTKEWETGADGFAQACRDAGWT